MKELRDNDFHTELISSKLPLVVLVSADWCGPCHIMHSTLLELEERHGNDVRFLELNVEDCPITAAELDIKYIPMTLIYRNGMLKKELTGVPGKDELMSAINSVLFELA